MRFALFSLLLVACGALPPRRPAPPSDSDGDGLVDTADRCPGWPEDRDGWQDTDGCEERDDDGDAIVDDRDRCPRAAEDYDGVNDRDGCPEIDGDRDHVEDMIDSCPLERETFGDDEEIDGCAGGSTPTGDRACEHEVPTRIAFADGSARIARRDANRVARLFNELGTRTEVTRFAVVGGAGSGERDGEELSLARAQAVATVLEEMGLPASRLVSHGVGTRFATGERSVWLVALEVDGEAIVVPEGDGLAPRTCGGDPPGEANP